MTAAESSQRTLRTTSPLSLRLTLGPLWRGPRDPTMRFGPDGMWRATRTPAGPATTHISAHPPEVTMTAWGPGAEWVLDHLPDLIGENDGHEHFEPLDPIVADLHHRLPGLRIPKTRAVMESLLPTILEQKVIGKQARQSYSAIVRAFGEPAPGPASLVLPPDPKRLAETPSWAFHRFNVERKRADTIRRACSYAFRLEETAELDLASAYARLTALPGIGPWSAAEVAIVALGDTDAVSVGDYHLPNQVAFALAGEARADDDRMLELLAPYRGHRGLVIRLIEAGGPAPPRFGPRLPLQSIEAI